ncbi:hypothetical protein ONZ45_g11874 [Pleurotus djamor]|nr:hypothetical protein ONZ45_g11874 [Pleurotus djamor]
MLALNGYGVLVGGGGWKREEGGEARRKKRGEARRRRRMGLRIQTWIWIWSSFRVGRSGDFGHLPPFTIMQMTSAFTGPRAHIQALRSKFYLSDASASLASLLLLLMMTNNNVVTLSLNLPRGVCLPRRGLVDDPAFTIPYSTSTSMQIVPVGGGIGTLGCWDIGMLQLITTRMAHPLVHACDNPEPRCGLLSRWIEH